MGAVVFEHVWKIYDGVKGSEKVAVKDFHMEVEKGEFLVLVGPSGCGKSTTLRMLAGLEEISRGAIYIDGKKVNDTPPKDRDIAMVFQNYALYPHMTVYKNMAFGLMLRKVPKKEIEERVMQAAKFLGLLEPDNLLNRKPKALSGGQRQRVALGRAMVRNPKVFLFDEPLSNLDAKMRVETRTEISKLQARLNTTLIYVTHDQVEAMTMGDKIVVMNMGEVQQAADPLTVYNNPANMFVAGFIGSPPMNFFRGKVVGEKQGVYFVEDKKPESSFEPVKLKLNDTAAKVLSERLGKPIVMGIRPEDIEDKLISLNPDPEHIFKARVDVVEPMGAETFFYVHTSGQSIISRSKGQHIIKVNEIIELVANMNKAHFFDPDTQRALA
jgi:multiple sugar transport system ATP-binding protein